MGYSLRTAAYIREQNRLKAERRAAEMAEAQRVRETFHRDFLDRNRAAAALGLSIHGFKRAQLAGKGPSPTKMGTTPQSRTFWHRDEIARYLANPAAYELTKTATHSAG